MNVTRLRAGRDHWKLLAVKRRKETEARDRQLAKKAKKIDKLEGDLRTARQRIHELERSSQGKITPPAPILRVEVRVICVMMYLIGIVPCNAVSRVLGFFAGTGRLECNWIPHPSSVVNWVARAGLGRLAAVVPKETPWIAIIDTSIAFGKSKVLVVLRVAMNHFTQKSAALTLADTECIGVVVGETWNGETVCTALEEVFLRSGLPTAILKDGGGDLCRGVRLLGEKHKPIPVLRDVGHVVANELKALYTRNGVLARYLKIIDSARSRMCQTVIAALRPPKIRAKGRFQSISRVVKWSAAMLEIVSGSGRAETGGLKDQLRKALPGISGLRFFIRRFSRDCTVLNSFLLLLKDNGLNQKSFSAAEKFLAELPVRSKMRKNLMSWLRKHIRIQCQLSMGQDPLPVSSDVIETLMGAIKYIIERTPVPEFGTLTLAIPLLCGNPSEEEIRCSLAECSHERLTKWRSENCNYTHRKVRQRLLELNSENPLQKTPIAEAS